MIRHILFDLDGTLLDSMDGIIATFQDVLRKKGYECPAESIVQHLAQGKNLPHIFCALLPVEQEPLVDECVASYISLYDACFPRETRLYDGVIELLVALQAREIHMALATSKRQHIAGLALKEFRIDHFFCCIGGFEDVRRHKPHPDIINKILSDRKWKQDETLMVGDTEADMNAGQEAGVRTCAALYGFSYPGILEQLCPDFTIDEPLALLEILQD